MLQLEDAPVHKELDLVHYSIDQHEPLAICSFNLNEINNQFYLCHEDADAAESAQDPVLEEGELHLVDNSEQVWKYQLRSFKDNNSLKQQ